MRKIYLFILCSLVCSASFAQIGAISGPTKLCIGAVGTMTDTTAGGTWSVYDITKATIGYTSGVVTGIAPGITTITYTTSSGFVTMPIVINPYGFPISGAPTVCKGNSVTMSDSISGGVWSVTNSNASISSAGVFTGLAAGLDTIVYTVTYSCGAAVSKKPMVIHGLPTVGPIVGDTTVCVNAYLTLTDSVAGGIWSSSNSGLATITSHGLVKGIAPTGSVTLTYSVSDFYCTANATSNISVIALPVLGTITGTNSLCVGQIDTLTDTTHVGTWSATNSSLSVSAHGVVLGISPGVDTVLFSKTTSCGVFTKQHVVTVNALPYAGILSVPKDSLCVGDTMQISASVPGGYWLRTNIDASLYGAGLIVGAQAGWDTIKYRITSPAGCGVDITQVYIKILPQPKVSSISGLTTYCLGKGDTLKDPSVGGVWGVQNSNCSITPAGYLKAVSAGLDTVTYSVSNSCGTAVAHKAITVHPNPYAGVITDSVGAVCIGSATTLTDTVPGGYWTKSNANAYIVDAGAPGGTQGMVTGLVPGMDTILYLITSPYGCGRDTARAPILVEAYPTAGTITGPGLMCVGSQYTMRESATSGIWSFNNTDATISGTGVVTPAQPGYDTVYYTVTSLYCGSAVAAYPVTLQSLASCQNAVEHVNAIEGKFYAYPNPNYFNTLTLHVEGSSNRTVVDFVNTVGQVDLSSSVTGTETTVDISMLPKGYYTVVVVEDGVRVAALKFVRL